MLSICGAYVSDVPVAWMLVDLAVVGPAWLTRHGRTSSRWHLLLILEAQLLRVFSCLVLE